MLAKMIQHQISIFELNKIKSTTYGCDVNDIGRRYQPQFLKSYHLSSQRLKFDRLGQKPLKKN